MTTSYCHMPSVGTWISGVGSSNEVITTDGGDSPVTKAVKETPLADFIDFDKVVTTDGGDSPVTKAVKETPLADFIDFDKSFDVGSPCTKTTMETPLDLRELDEAVETRDADLEPIVENVSPMGGNHEEAHETSSQIDDVDCDKDEAAGKWKCSECGCTWSEQVAVCTACETPRPGHEDKQAHVEEEDGSREAKAEVPSPKASGSSSTIPAPQSLELKPGETRRTGKPIAKVAAGPKVPQSKAVAPVKKVQKPTVSTPAVSKAAAVRKASPNRSTTPTVTSTASPPITHTVPTTVVSPNGDTKPSGKVSPRGPVTAPRATPKATARASTPTRKAPEETGTKRAAGSSKVSGQTSPRQTSPRRVPAMTGTASTSSLRNVGTTWSNVGKADACVCGATFPAEYCNFCRKCGAKRPENKVTKPVEGTTTTLRTSKSATTLKTEGADVNAAPPSSPRPSPSASRTAQTPKREAPQTSTVADEFRTPRKSSTQVPTSERLTQLAQAHKPKSMTSNELEALAIQKACEDARRLREKNARAVGRQAAARALAAAQENTAETPQPNSTETSGKRSPLRTRPAGNVEIVAAKTKTIAAAQVSTEATKENRSVDHTVGKVTNAKKSPLSSAPQRPSTPLTKKGGPVVAATRA